MRADACFYCSFFDLPKENNGYTSVIGTSMARPWLVHGWRHFPAHSVGTVARRLPRPYHHQLASAAHLNPFIEDEVDNDIDLQGRALAGAGSRCPEHKFVA
jgi:hypothetical protein